MDVLKEAAITQSTEHLQLLLFILNVVFVLFLPYLGFLLGTSLVSCRYNVLGRRERNETFLRFARDLVDTPMLSKGAVVFLAVLPSVSLVFLYAQILQDTPAIAVGLMGFGCIALIAGVALLLYYRFTFNLGGILSGYESLMKKEGRQEERIADYARRNERNHLRAGRYGIGLLVVSGILIVGAFADAVDPTIWPEVDTVFDLLLVPGFYAAGLELAAVALGVTGVGILYFLLSWQGGVKNRAPEYDALIRRTGLRAAFLGLMLQPVTIPGSLALLPDVAASGMLYGLSGLALALVFVVLHFLYAFRLDGRTLYVSRAFVIMVIAFVLILTKDRLAIGNGIREHGAHLAVAYEKESEDLRNRLGIAAVTMSGKEIYDARCSACHLFDERKVGPPYRSVIPKYGGNKARLVAFILNPVKVDPAYPNMPNQGLKPQEADSIASFLLREVATAPQKPSGETP